MQQKALNKVRVAAHESFQSIHRARRIVSAAHGNSARASITCLPGYFMRSLKTWKVPFACALAVTSLPLALVDHGPNGGGTVAGHRSPTRRCHAAPAAAPGAVEVSLNDALGRHWVEAQYLGNGRSEIKATLANQRSKPLRLTVGSGTDFRDRRSAQPDGRRARPDARPAGRQHPRGVAGVRGDAFRQRARPPAYRLCPDTLQILAHLFARWTRARKSRRDAIQTAVLLLTENAPLGLFAKFTLLSGDAPAAPADGVTRSTRAKSSRRSVCSRTPVIPA